MRLIDLLTLPLIALWQQKLRTILTTLGVVFGAFVLAASLSIGEGVQKTIDRESHRSDIARRVEVFPKWNVTPTPSDISRVEVEGTMTEARRARLRKALADLNTRSDRSQVQVTLTGERLEKVRQLPHVETVIPVVHTFGFALLGTKSVPAQIRSARPTDASGRKRIVAGKFFDAPNQHAVVVNEALAYRLGLVNDRDVDTAIGKPLRLEFPSSRPVTGFGVYLFRVQGDASREEVAALDKIRLRLPDSLEKLGLTEAEIAVLRRTLNEAPAADAEPEAFTAEFTVAGVIRNLTAEEAKEPWDPLRANADLLLPYQTALELFFRIPSPADRGVDQAVVIVDSETNVKEVVERITELGIESRSAVEFIDQQRLIYLLIFGGMTCVAGVGLLVAALGITNTMLMSVLERTREIGIMKAVGADSGHLQFIFLFEGALIGLFGAALGLVLAWSASFPADNWVRSMVQRDLKVDLTESIFVFPLWMIATVLLFSMLVTTLAALYPARHAARIDPVSALRHE